MRRLNRAAKNIMVGFGGHFLLIFFPFIVRAVMIKRLGIDYLGIGSLFSSILGALTLAELGFGSAAVYFLYEPVAKGMTEKVNMLLAFYKRVFRIIGFAILIIGLSLLPFLDKLISGSYPQEINIYIVYCIQLAGTVISYFFFSYKCVLLSAALRDDVISLVSTCVNAAMYIVQIALLLLFRNYYTYAVVLPVCILLTNVIRSVICDKLYPQYRCQGQLPETVKKDIYQRIAALFGHKLNRRVIQTADSVVISSFLGLAISGIYSNYYYILYSVAVTTEMITDVIRPIVGNYMVCEDESKSLQILHRFLFGFLWLTSFCCTSFVCLYQHFITLWVGEAYLLGFSSVLLLALYYWIWKMGDIFMLFRDAAGLWLKVKYYPYISAVTNLAINILLVKQIGINGVILSTVLTLGLISIPCEIRSIFKNYFHCSPKETIFLLVKYTAVMMITTAATFLFTQYVIGGSSIWRFILKGLACCIVPNGIFIALFRNTSEFAFYKDYCLEKIHRRGKI